MITNFEVKYDWVSRSIIFKLDDDNYSAIWVNHKTVFGPYPKPKYIWAQKSKSTPKLGQNQMPELNRA